MTLPFRSLLYFFCAVFLSISPLCVIDAAAVSPIRLLTPQALATLTPVPIIIDARPLSEWQRGHIPQSVPLYWDDFPAVEVKGFTLEIIANRLGRIGISEQATVVVYGDAGSSLGGEGWVCWLLKALGHKGQIFLLEGGVQAWSKNHLPLATQPPTQVASPVDYHPSLTPAAGMATEELVAAQGRVQIIDTRSFFERMFFAIPGSVHINWTNFYQGQDRIPISKSQLVRLLKQHRIDPQKTVVYYCTGGIRSAYAWTVHELSGLPPAINYAGGTAAWQDFSAI